MAFSVRCIAPRAPTFRPTVARRVGTVFVLPVVVRAMASSSSSSSQQLDKSTPEETWKKLLSPEEYQVLRLKGTERPGTGEYDKFYEEGTYVCRGCGNPLYPSEAKFKSGCGWPAYYDCFPGSVERHEDNTFGMRRVEITCANCGGHLGHVFSGEGFPTPTDERHCVNSLSVKFIPKSKEESS